MASSIIVDGQTKLLLTAREKLGARPVMCLHPQVSTAESQGVSEKSLPNALSSPAVLNEKIYVVTQVIVPRVLDKIECPTAKRSTFIIGHDCPRALIGAIQIPLQDVLHHATAKSGASACS
jgi:hypothetical protein